MERRVAALSMSCNIVREISTMSVPQRYAGNVSSSQSLAQIILRRCDVSFPRSSVPVRVVSCGVCKSWLCGLESEYSRQNRTKEICSVSVSRSKVSRLLVADWHWKYGVLHLSRPILNGLTRYLGGC